MNSIDPAIALAVALALGLLIGLERGWRERASDEGSRVAGVRTYGLVGLLGGLTGLLALETQLAVVGLGALAVAVAFATGYVLHYRRTGDIGLTSVIAGLLTFAFGAAATLGYMAEGAMAAVATGVLLRNKTLLHRWVSAIEPEELRATLKLLAISIIVLPLLPNQGYGPWQALNPFEIWWMVVLIAGISFSGYFAMKIVGPDKGAIITGLLAGLAASTALTLHFSRLTRSQPKAGHILAPGILLACAMVFPRLVAVAAAVHWPTAKLLVIPAASMGGVLFVSAALLWWTAKKEEFEASDTPVQNPLQLGSAILFGALLAGILLAAKGLEAAFGEAGLGALAVISGFTDVDAITLTLTKLSQSQIPSSFAAFGIVVAAAVNSAVKGSMTLAVGGWSLGKRTTAPLLIAAGFGVVTTEWP